MKKWEAAYIAGIIDGEGSITLTRMHKGENRRPCILISSNDIEMLVYIQNIIGGTINTKKNYNPSKHQQSYTLAFKNKTQVFYVLEKTLNYLRVSKKKKRAEWILTQYDVVTLRNGKYNANALKKKLQFERKFFEL